MLEALGTNHAARNPQGLDVCAVGRCREQNHDGLYDIVIIALVIVALFFGVGWLGGGAAFAVEHDARLAAEQKVSAQATEVARYKPTPTRACWYGTMPEVCH